MEGEEEFDEEEIGSAAANSTASAMSSHVAESRDTTCCPPGFWREAKNYASHWPQCDWQYFTIENGVKKMFRSRRQAYRAAGLPAPSSKRALPSAALPLPSPPAYLPPPSLAATPGDEETSASLSSDDESGDSDPRNWWAKVWIGRSPLRSRREGQC